VTFSSSSIYKAQQFTRIINKKERKKKHNQKITTANSSTFLSKLVSNAYHNVKLIEITVNKTMLCQTNNNAKYRLKNSFWIL